MKYPRKVIVREVGPRDGFQMEKKFVPTEEKIKIVNMLSDCGFQEIQVTAFVHPKMTPNMADAEEVFSKINKKPKIVYSGLIPNMKGLERAKAVNVGKVEFTMSSTDSHSKNNLNTTTEGSLKQMAECLERKGDVNIIAGISVTFGCPYEGRPEFSRIDWIVGEVVKLGITEISLGDTVGTGDPQQVYDYYSSLIKKYPDVHFAFHPHNTHGLAFANVLAALEAGVSFFDASIAGLGGCPYAEGASGNISTEDLAQMLDAMGVETGLDIDGIIKTAQYTHRLLGHCDSATMRAGKLIY